MVVASGGAGKSQEPCSPFDTIISAVSPTPLVSAESECLHREAIATALDEVQSCAMPAATFLQSPAQASVIQPAASAAPRRPLRH
jgi:hypothetical protein